MVLIQDGMRRGSDIYHAEDGHSYHANKARNGKLYLRCYRYRNPRCKGTACVNVRDGSFRSLQVHNHRAPKYLVYERRFRHAVLNCCRAGDTATFKEIYNRERRRLRTPKEAAANVSFVKLRPSMQRARGDALPRIPHSLTELGNILLDPTNVHISQTLDEKDDIFAGMVGSTNERTRCILLFSKRMLKYLGSVDVIFSDATFVVPLDLGCYQVWNLVTLRRYHIVRLGRVLMQSKQTNCYVEALRGLQQLVPTFRPRKVHCDFETMEQNAWAEVYPNAELYGCHFHHVKAVCSKAKELGLTELLRNNEHADNIVRSLCAVPLLPHDMLVEGFMSALNNAERRGLHQLIPLLNYYAQTWLLNATRFRALSVYGCAFRTSNCVECENRTLRAEIKVKRPNIYQLFVAFVNLEDEGQVQLETLRQGWNASRTRRHSSLANDTVIKNLSEDLEEGNIDAATFIRRASRRIQGAYDEFIHFRRPLNANNE